MRGNLRSDRTLECGAHLVVVGIQLRDAIVAFETFDNGASRVPTTAVCKLRQDRLDELVEVSRVRQLERDSAEPSSSATR